MKRIIEHIAIIAAALLLPTIALAFEPMAAAVKVSGGGVYDYVMIGESPKATDGFDNAYDSTAPGASLNSTYISTYFSHPEWGAIKKAFKGDIRSLAEKQEWTLSIATTLPVGTPLTVELQAGLNILPHGLQLTVKDTGNTTTANLIGGRLSLASPAPGTTTQLIITALQPAGTPTTTPPPVDPVVPPVTSVTPTVDPVPVVPSTPGVIATGDVDGDGQTTIIDALRVLRMALGLDITTTAARNYGDMDGDGRLTIRDALMLIRKSIGL